MPKLIRLNKIERIVDVIKKIKAHKGNEIVFEVPANSALIKDPHNFSLMKKSAQAMGKTVMIRASDPIVKSLTAKAGLLLDESGEYDAPEARTKVKKVRFSDLSAQTMHKPSRPMPVKVSEEPEKVRILPTVPKLSLPKSRFKFPSIGSNFSKIFVLGVVVLVLIVFGLAVLLPQATITVYARSEPIVRDIEVSVDKELKTINSAKLAVPGELVSREISHTKNFPTTGIKLSGTKATGNVQLFNFTKNTLTLRAATTTLIVDGKKYSFTKDVTGLRPTARIGQGGEQEVDKSSLIPPVPIVAQEVGANFNIGADLRLTIQNAALGQADVFAETVGAVTGGTSTETKILVQQDIDNALKAMQAELPALTEAEIVTANSNDSIKIESNAVKSEILAKTESKDLGDEATNFDMTIIAKVSALSYDEQDVKALILEKINTVLSEDKYLLETAKKDLQANFKAVDIDKGVGVLAAHFETVAAYKVENTNLTKILAGKDAIEIKEILLTKPEIDRVDVQFSPFFVRKAPKFNGKIYIKTVQS
jgi:hypothetical protein